MRKERHVVYNFEKQCLNRRNNGLIDHLKIFFTKEERNWRTQKAKSEIIPHKKNDLIQNPNSYGNDPLPPKDKKT